MEAVQNNPSMEYLDYVDNIINRGPAINISPKEADLLVDMVDFIQAGFSIKHGDVVLEKSGLTNVFKNVVCLNAEQGEYFNSIKARGICFVYTAQGLQVKGFNVRVPLKYENVKDIVSLLLHGKRMYNEQGELIEFDLNTLAVRTINETSEDKVAVYGRMEFGGAMLPPLYVNRTTFLTPDEIMVVDIQKLLGREIDLTAEEIRLIVKHKRSI